MRKTIERAWRYIEGLHTIEWLVTLFSVGVLTVFGRLSGVTWYWLIVGAVVIGVSIIVALHHYPLYTRILPLPAACRIAFEKLHGTAFVEIAHGFGNTPDRRLDVMAGHLALEAPILGKRPPSPVFERLSKHLLAQGTFTGGATQFNRHGEEQPQYIDLSIDGREFRRAIKRLKEQDDAASRNIG